jgi:hypothetical protein
VVSVPKRAQCTQPSTSSSADISILAILAVRREMAPKKRCTDTKEMQAPTDDSDHNASDVPCTDKFCQKQNIKRKINKLKKALL